MPFPPMDQRHGTAKVPLNAKSHAEMSTLGIEGKVANTIAKAS
jgi:hypothetical protein